MSRYIKPIELKAHALRYVRTQPHFHYGDWDNMCISGKELDEIIDTCPTADVVEVVRCKDCVYCRLYNDGKLYCHKKANIFVPIVDADDFCSYGERKENER